MPYILNPRQIRIRKQKFSEDQLDFLCLLCKDEAVEGALREIGLLQVLRTLHELHGQNIDPHEQLKNQKGLIRCMMPKQKITTQLYYINFQVDSTNRTQDVSGIMHFLSAISPLTNSINPRDENLRISRYTNKYDKIFTKKKEKVKRKT